MIEGLGRGSVAFGHLSVGRTAGWKGALSCGAQGAPAVSLRLPTGRRFPVSGEINSAWSELEIPALDRQTVGLLVHADT